MSPHGPDAETTEKAFHQSNDPKYLNHTLAIMFESCFPYRVTEAALKSPQLQKNYLDCWKNLKVNFKAEKK